MSNELSLVQGPPVEISTTRSSFAPTNIVEAMEFSKMLAASNFVPKDFQGKPGDILVAMQWGLEIGLAPLQALQNIAVINGRPTIWGDAALGIVQAHHEYMKHEEGVRGEGDAMVGWHTITRRGHQPHTVEFSVADAKKAGLWGKTGPWTTYPKRMLKLRARGWAIRDKFADALKGIITREEAQDMSTAIDATPAQPIIAEITISMEQAMEFFQAWKNVGKHPVDDVKAYLMDQCGVTNSRMMPLSRFDDALDWAKTPKGSAAMALQATQEAADVTETNKDAVPSGEVAVDAKADAEKAVDNLFPPATDEDPGMVKSIHQLFDILGTPAKMQKLLMNDHKGKLAELKAKLEKDLPE